MGQEERLGQLLQPVVTALGYELVGVEYVAQGRHSLLRVYIDSEQGITVHDCERVSRQVSAVLDVEDPIWGQYTLEVSSPGMDRPLFTAEHYSRYVGSLVQIRLNVPRDGRRKFKGRLLGQQDGEIRIEVDGEERRFTLDEIDKANLVPEW